MSQSVQEYSTSGSTSSSPSARRRGRIVIVATLVLSLLASAGARYLVDTRRAIAIPQRGGSASGTSLSSMNSFALGLLLGGLRGPLVMFLWTQSESQKTDKNLEGFDTQIEWIRLLQPEFDTVHIFQIWNKAYNVSVQMASLANKYSVILDALDYAHSVDREKPDDINIIAAIAQIYFDKLGGSTEHLYYRPRVRLETLPHPVSPHHPNDPGWRRVKLDPMLDEQFNVLPELTRPATMLAHPSKVVANEEPYNGAELQYLPQWQPFPDGLSPYALSYNYYKRAEALQNQFQQRHAQLSDPVIDSRPALALKNWAQDEWEQGRRREGQAFGLAIPDERADLEPLTADLSPTHPITNRHAAELAVFAYSRAADLAPAAITEYLRHISNYPDINQDNYRSQVEDIQCAGVLCSADQDYLSACLASGQNRAQLLTAAAQLYRQAIYLYEINVLKYYTDPDYLAAALPKGFGRFKTAQQSGVDELNPQQADAAVAAVYRARGNRPESHNEDLKEYVGYMQRASARLQQIAAAPK